MFRPLLAAAVSVACASLLVLAAGVASAGKGPEPVTSVKLAKSWNSAIDEAKTLNVPVVVHHHGFYCPPCWGMHKTVMCNEDYIKFANEKTVEVIALQDLQKGIDAGDHKADEYDGKDDDGRPAKFVAEFPGLTRSDLLALHASKASSYNDTGGIPFTVIVDPWTEKEMARFAGGGHSPDKIIAAVNEQTKVLNSAHGPSISRAVLTKANGEVKRVSDVLAKDGVSKAFAELKKAEKGFAKEAEAIRKRFEPVRAAILAAAGEQLDAAQEKLDAGDMPGAKKLLDKLGRSLDGTDLEARQKELAGKLAPAK